MIIAITREEQLCFGGGPNKNYDPATCVVVSQEYITLLSYIVTHTALGWIFSNWTFNVGIKNITVSIFKVTTFLTGIRTYFNPVLGIVLF